MGGMQGGLSGFGFRSAVNKHAFHLGTSEAGALVLRGYPISPPPEVQKL